MSDISTWSSVANNNNAAAPNGFPENMPPSGVNDAAREVMASVRRQFEDTQWFNHGHTLTYVDATSFTIDGDVREDYEIGRRMRLKGTTPFTSYATITATTFENDITTITFTVDSGDTFDNTANEIALGIITRSNNALPTGLTNVTFQSKAVNADRDLESSDASRFLRVDTSSGKITLTMPDTFPFGDGDVFYVHNIGGAGNANQVIVKNSDGSGYNTNINKGATIGFISNGSELQVMNAAVNEFAQTESNQIHTDNLVMFLDAGNSASYDGTSQTFKNLVSAPADGSSQTDYDMYLGINGLVEQPNSDPIFTGVAGAGTANEAFVFHQWDILNLKRASNTDFLNSLHKANAAFTIELWVTTASMVTNNNSIWFNTAAASPHSGGGAGIQLRMVDDRNSVSTQGFGFRCYASQSNLSMRAYTDTILQPNTTYMVAISVDAAGNSFFYINGNYAQVGSADQFASVYGSGSFSSPTTGNSAVKFRCGHPISEHNLNIDNNQKLHLFRVYNSNLSKAELDLNWLSTKGRFGL